ncbi:MAG: hypothetical protein ACI30P_03710, partial [Muribaculaceae bacterium]
MHILSPASASLPIPQASGLPIPQAPACQYFNIPAFPLLQKSSLFSVLNTVNSFSIILSVQKLAVPLQTRSAP